MNAVTQELYVSDMWNHVIRVISLESETVKTLCGTPKMEGRENGTPSQAKFWYPKGLGFDPYSHCLYVSDQNQVIRKISLLEEGRVSTFCGIKGKDESRDGAFSTFNCPIGIAMDSHSQSLYVMEFGENKVRKIIDKKTSLS